MNISLNGTKIETSAEWVSELNCCGDVIIVNGYQISSDYLLCENDEIYIIKKGVMPSREALEGMLCARHTPGVHQKLKVGQVAIAGLGGLGSHIAVALARLGVGKLLLVDFDVVEPSNLNRQNYDISHLGMLKTVALKNQLQKINPYINIEVSSKKVTQDNVLSIFNPYPIVCEAFDNPESKAFLVNTLLLDGRKKIVASSGMAGFESGNNIKTQRKLKNLYVCGDFRTGAEIGVGLMSPRVMLCAAHQANVVLRLLLGFEKE